jgi:tRNA 2-thiouridine synthesizing protein C
VTRKRILYLVGRAPGLGALTREVIDAILVAAAFDQDVGVLFTGDGVLQLAPGDPDHPHSARDPTRAWLALPTYEVTRVYVDQAAVSRARLAGVRLTLEPQLVPATDLAELIAAHDVVLTG